MCTTCLSVAASISVICFTRARQAIHFSGLFGWTIWLPRLYGIQLRVRCSPSQPDRMACERHSYACCPFLVGLHIDQARRRQQFLGMDEVGGAPLACALGWLTRLELR
jgi:hypothetical protein